MRFQNAFVEAAAFASQPMPHDNSGLDVRIPASRFVAALMMAATAQPTAAARCMGPVSLPKYNMANLSNSASSVIDKSGESTRFGNAGFN